MLRCLARMLDHSDVPAALPNPSARRAQLPLRICGLGLRPAATTARALGILRRYAPRDRRATSPDLGFPLAGVDRARRGPCPAGRCGCARCRRCRRTPASLCRTGSPLLMGRRMSAFEENERVGRHGHGMAACSLHGHRPQATPRTLIQSLEFRLTDAVLLLLPAAPRHCRCGKPLDVLGDHRAACPTAGVLKQRSFPCLCSRLPRGRGACRDRWLLPRPQPRCSAVRWALDRGRRVWWLPGRR